MFFGFVFFIGELRCVPYLVAIRHVLVDYCKCTRIKLFQSIRTSLSRLWKEQKLMIFFLKMKWPARYLARKYLAAEFNAHDICHTYMPHYIWDSRTQTPSSISIDMRPPNYSHDGKYWTASYARQRSPPHSSMEPDRFPDGTNELLIGYTVSWPIIPHTITTNTDVL